MATDELDRYMLSLEGYLRKVDALDHHPRQTLCKTLLPNFGHIGVIFLANHTCPQALRGLQIVIKLIYHAKEFSNSSGQAEGGGGQETKCPILDDFIDQLQGKIINGKIATDRDLDAKRLTFLLPKYRQSLVLTLIKDCLANSNSTDSCIMRNPLTEYCCSLNSLFFTIILTFCDILKLTDGHWFIGKIIGSFKRIVTSQVPGNTIQLYPPHLRSFLPHLELLDLQLAQQFTISCSSQPHRVADKLCFKLNYSLLPGICKWDEIVALLILYPSAADFLVSHKPQWIHKLRNWSERSSTTNSNINN